MQCFPVLRLGIVRALRVAADLLTVVNGEDDITTEEAALRGVGILDISKE